MQAVKRVTGVVQTTNRLKFELGNLHKRDQWKGGCYLTTLAGATVKLQRRY